MKMDLSDVKADINYFITMYIQEKIKGILEEAPLYSNYSIELQEFDKVIKDLRINDAIPEPNRGDLKQYYDSIPKFNWNVVSKYGERGGYTIPQTDRRNRAPFLNIIFPQTLSLFCSECNSVEAFNFVDTSSLIGYDLYNLHDPNIQVFSISYQCQMCKNRPEVFLLRRKNLKISIDGRSPIQQVEVSNFLPKDQKKFIKKSVIAFNSGEILAALFFQRTFLEQFVRIATNDLHTRELEKVFEIYKGMLPEKFNSLWPSLGAIYSRISEDLHAANPSKENYFTSKSEIETHFEALHLFKKQGLIN